MKEYEEKFSKAIKWYEKKDLKNFGTGFNINLDLVTTIDERFCEKLGTNKKRIKEIKDLKDLSRGIKLSGLTNSGLQWRIKDEKLLPKIEALKKYAQYIGGQGGIVNNHLADIGVKNRLLMTAKYNKEFKKYLDLKNCEIFTTEGFSLKENTKKVRKNFIFEYKKGFFKKAKRNNRFIASTPSTKKPLFGLKNLETNFKKLEQFKKFFLTGYHKLKGKEFNQGRKELKLLNQAFNSIHYEMISVEDQKIRKNVLSTIKGNVHSVGVNEFELKKYTGLKNPIKALIKLGKLTQAKRISFHALGYFLTYYNNFKPSENEENALIMSDVFAVSKAETNKTHLLTPYSDNFFDKANSQKLLDLGLNFGVNNEFISIPTKIITDAKRTVGMGDVISSTSYFLS